MLSIYLILVLTAIGTIGAFMFEMYIAIFIIVVAGGLGIIYPLYILHAADESLGPLEEPEIKLLPPLK